MIIARFGFPRTRVSFSQSCFICIDFAKLLKFVNEPKISNQDDGVDLSDCKANWIIKQDEQ